MKKIEVKIYNKENYHTVSVTYYDVADISEIEAIFKRIESNLKESEDYSFKFVKRKN